jgi:hypothetical protein
MNRRKVVNRVQIVGIDKINKLVDIFREGTKSRLYSALNLLCITGTAGEHPAVLPKISNRNVSFELANQLRPDEIDA